MVFGGNNLSTLLQQKSPKRGGSARRVNRKVIYKWWKTFCQAKKFALDYKLPSSELMTFISIFKEWNTKLLMKSNLQWHVEYLCFQIQKASESSYTGIKKIYEKILIADICFQKRFTWYKSISFFKNYANSMRCDYYYSILEMKF